MSTGYNRDRFPFDPPSLTELLDCLRTYPEGTQGHADETNVISTIYGLCRRHGFGRVSQFAEAIDAIWRKSEKADRLVRFYAQNRKDMHELAAAADDTTDA